MKTAGIIAEYNPFHNGHKYHIEETRRQTGADYVIAVMSGSFVQRGAPAVLSKYDRARMALLDGADLVFELPAVASLRSAEGFATGGISLLDGLGVVDTVSCGCESAYSDPALFSAVVSLLSAEPEEYRKILTDSLRSGMNYPKARETAVRALIPEASGGFAAGDPGELPSADPGGLPSADPGELPKGDPVALLSEPNDTLALEYARAIKKTGSGMDLCLIPRQGTGRHSAAGIREFLLSDDTSAGSLAAAAGSYNVSLTAAAGSSEGPLTAAAGSSDGSLSAAAGSLTVLEALVPPDVCDFLLSARSEHRLLCENDFSDLLFYALTVNRDRLNEFGPKNSDLTNRIANLTEQFTDWSGFAELLKTKNITYTAVSRCLAQILLGISREDLLLASEYGNAPYARLLGFRKKAAPILKAVSENASIPVITRPAQDCAALGEEERHLFDFDVRGAEICRQILQSRSGLAVRSEFRQPLLTVR